MSTLSNEHIVLIVQGSASLRLSETAILALVHPFIKLELLSARCCFIIHVVRILSDLDMYNNSWSVVLGSSSYSVGQVVDDVVELLFGFVVVVGDRID